MLPLLLALALFGHFVLTGQACQALLGIKLGRTRSWLLAPALGIAVLGLMGMFLNQAGLPFQSFSRWVCAAITLSAIGVLSWKKVKTPIGWSNISFILIFILLLSGWPLLFYSWNWVGYGNDDMTNYCLGAERFLRHGFYDIPQPAELSGGDYSQLYWMLYVAGQIRFGSEQMLAYAAGITGLKTTAVFTPTLLAFGLAQITSIMALAGNSNTGRRAAMLAALTLGAAPLWHAGINYQLIAQIAGLSLFASTLVLIARSRFPKSRNGLARFAGASAILLAALCIYYPELLPFLVLGWVTYILVQMMQRKRWLVGLIPAVGMALLFILILLRHNVVSTTITLLAQTSGGLDVQASIDRASLFPYFLMPSGAAFFLGFDIFVSRYPEPWSSIALVGGLIALGVAVLVLLWKWKRHFSVSSALLVIMLPIGAIFFQTGNGFGLFKLVMFALPFLILEIVRQALRSRYRRTITIGYLLLLVTWCTGAWRYSMAFTNLGSNSGGEMLNASHSIGALPDQPAWSDTASAPINKLLMLAAPDASPVFLSQLVVANLLGKSAKPYPDWVWRLIPGEATGATAKTVANYIQTEAYHQRHALGLHFWEPHAAARTPGSEDILITSLAEQRALNKLGSEPFLPTEGLFTYAPISELKNHLIFVQSQEGQHYYLGSPGHIAIYRSQPDVFQPESHFFAVGRHLLLRILNPDKTIRVRLAMSATVLGKGRTGLPQNASLRFGENRATKFGFVGSGGANVYSPPIAPFWINGAAYVAIDLGQPPIPLGLPAQDLQGLYNQNLSIDTRLALGYCRDISVIDEASYQSRKLRREISDFPNELLSRENPEYSGFYEDGWVSGHAYIMLGPVNPGDTITVSAQMPQKTGPNPIPTKVELLADGMLLQTKEIVSGSLEMEAPLPNSARQVKIELRFDRTEPLPSPDDRPISVLLKAIKITPSQ